MFYPLTLDINFLLSHYFRSIRFHVLICMTFNISKLPTNSPGTLVYTEVPAATWLHVDTTSIYNHRISNTVQFKFKYYF
ncbi:unnamed protein product [Allacma fusca]|uniref:Uncharacterized protein n=1 Tax=Allacma fusca TaxID=39272 RepID=A0A8J2P353_9HEXA|nr:unnamed protein product [Allacma fusca]